MTPRDLARGAAAIGWGLCAIASLGVVGIMSQGAGVYSDRYASSSLAGSYSALVLWCVLPLGLATISSLAILLNLGAVFALPPVGALGALTVMAAFSVGPFFGPATVFFLAAGLIHLISQEAWWRISMSWLWLLAGASALLPLLSLLTQLHQAVSDDNSRIHGATGFTFFGVTMFVLVTSEVVHAVYVNRH